MKSARLLRSQAARACQEMLVIAADMATVSSVHMPQPHLVMSARLCWNAGTLLQLYETMKFTGITLFQVEQPTYWVGKTVT